jgi:hypothetical protein
MLDTAYSQTTSTMGLDTPAEHQFRTHREHHIQTHVSTTPMVPVAVAVAVTITTTPSISISTSTTPTTTMMK